jgi:hypothetical protein
VYVKRFPASESSLMRTAALLLALPLCLATPSAVAALVKCAGDIGVVYQDVPCPPGRELRDLEADPPTLSVVPGTPPPASVRERAPSVRGAKQHATRMSTHRVKGGSAAERRFVHNGMSEAEVIMRIGRPDVRTKGGGKSGQRWSYFPAAGDADTMTTVTFTGGKVVDVERRVAR